MHVYLIFFFWPVCMSLTLSIYMPAYLSHYLLIYLPVTIYLSHLYNDLSTNLSIYAPVCFIRKSTHLSNHSLTYEHFCLSFSLTLNLLLCLFSLFPLLFQHFLHCLVFLVLLILSFDIYITRILLLHDNLHRLFPRRLLLFLPVQAAVSRGRQ